MDAVTIRNLDGPALTRLAFELGLAPEGVENLVRREGRIDFGKRKLQSLAVEFWWEPDTDIAQADAIIRQLRSQGFSTSVIWLADDRQYGEAWVGCEGARAYSARWPENAKTEALAILRCAVLAVFCEKSRLAGAV